MQRGDAFVTASLSGFGLVPKLVFLVIDPAVDLKLIVLESRTFGRAFAARFALTTFVVAIANAVLVGSVFAGVRDAAGNPEPAAGVAGRCVLKISFNGTYLPM